MPLLQENRLPAPAGTSELLRDLVHERLGIYYDNTRLDALLDKLEDPARASNCKTFLEFFFLLKYEATEADWHRAMDALSVQETYFWREFAQLKTLAEDFAPRWFRNSAKPLRIWSAACATGEEPYSIAMALEEAGLGNKPIQILASDASPAAIGKARRGFFRERSFRSLPGDLMQKYFTPAPGGWIIAPSIMARVQFRTANILNRGEIAAMANCPAVFCRNVFIYFSPESVRKAVSLFAEFMPEGGHLFVGASESLVRITSDFELTDIGDAFVYLRRKP